MVVWSSADTVLGVRRSCYLDRERCQHLADDLLGYMMDFGMVNDHGHAWCNHFFHFATVAGCAGRRKK